MHRTLKAKATKPPAPTNRKQQVNFDAFMAEFNHVRPHQSLGQRRPATLVERYRREFPERLPEVEYPSSFTVRRVRGNGCINWLPGTVYIGSVLKGELVGLVQSAEDRWQLYFSYRHLADWCERKSRWVEPDRNDR
jgi:putative transposase